MAGLPPVEVGRGVRAAARLGFLAGLLEQRRERAAQGRARVLGRVMGIGEAPFVFAGERLGRALVEEPCRDLDSALRRGLVGLEIPRPMRPAAGVSTSEESHGAPKVRAA